MIPKCENCGTKLDMNNCPKCDELYIEDFQIMHQIAMHDFSKN